VKYLNEHLGGTAKVLIVPECGHNDRCVFTTDSVLPVIFPPRLGDPQAASSRSGATGWGALRSGASRNM
jgi:hypothetical protein